MPFIDARRKRGSGSGSFNPYVHGARGLFSAMVFVFHIANSGFPTFSYPGSPLVENFLLSFKFGVEMFFGISGIVIIGALGRTPSLVAFGWDRFTRIYPVLWATLIAVVLLAHVTHKPLPNLRTIGLNFLVPPPGVSIPLLNPPAWSLSFEIGFYLLCTIGWKLRHWRPIARIAVGIGVVLTAIWPRCLLMGPGVLIYTGRLTSPLVQALSRFPLVMTILFLCTWRSLEMIGANYVGFISVAIMPFGYWIAYLPGMLLASLLGTAALLGINDGRGYLGRLLVTPSMQFLGTISYSFYLWHPMALEATKRLLFMTHLLQNAGQASQLLILVVALPVALIVSYVSQLLIERRFTRWLRGLVESSKQAHVPMTAAPPSQPDERVGLNPMISRPQHDR